MGARFADRLVVVTGGTGALGEGVVGALLGEGAQVRIPSFSVSELDAFRYADHDRVDIVGGIDLRSEASVVGFYEGAAGLWASLHIAGGFAMGPIAETSRDDFVAQHEMNVVTCFLSCREAVRAMLGTGKGGRIVSVSARPALAPAAGMVAYTTAKAGVASLTRCLAEEVRDDGIRVNAVAPSIMDTPTNREAMPDADHGAWPTVEEVAEAMLFLAAPQNTLTSGAVVPVYGRA